MFEYKFFQNWEGQRWHGALYFPGLHGGGVAAIRDLPDGYSPQDWSHSQYLYRSHGLNLGSITCGKCNYMKRHELSWPEEAYFSVQYRGQNLWAFHRESCVQLRHYIQSSDRKLDEFKWQSFLLHIPAVFKQKKARDYVVKKLDRLLRGKTL